MANDAEGGPEADGNGTSVSFASVSAGGDHTCGVKTDSSVACWGSNAYGKSTPPAGSFTSVSVGQDHTCGVKTGGSVVCWGFSSCQVTSPAGSFASVSAGSYHTCGVARGGSVVCGVPITTGNPPRLPGPSPPQRRGKSHLRGKDGRLYRLLGFNKYGQSTPPGGSFASLSAGNITPAG